MFGIPLVLYGLDAAHGSEVTLTEAIRLTTATPVGLYLFVIFILSMIRPCWRRMRSLGLPGYWGLIVPLLLFADIPYFLTARSEGAFGFSISTLDGRVPIYLLMAVGLVIAMVLARPLGSDDSVSKRYGVVGKRTAGLAVLILAAIVFNLGMARWFAIATRNLGAEDAPPELLLQLTLKSYWVYVLNPYICALFAVLIAWCVVISRRSPDDLRLECGK
ncbi:hypothetical protein ACSVBT_16610 [Afipia sp. TerB]